jgi:hypothetical protein
MPTEIDQRLKHYGFVPLSDRIDISNVQCLSIDFRLETGGSAPDASCAYSPPHPFRYAIFVVAADYTAEIRFMIGAKEFALVGAFTGRAGVNELTPEHLSAAIADEKYAAVLREWS